jgi:type II secretory pathway component PulF
MIFKYEAKDGGGNTVSGTLEADTEQTAATQVRDMGYFPMRFRSQSLGNTATLDAPLRPTRLVEQKTTASSQVLDGYKQPFNNRPYGNWFERNLIFPISSGVSAKDLSIFFREFAAMLQAGVPITRCLESIGENHRGGQLGIAIRSIAKRVESGDTLTNSFGEFPHLFSELTRSMIAAGEESGGLDTMLLRVSEYLENEFTLREMIKRETFMTKIEIVAAITLPRLVVWLMSGWNAYFHQVLQPALLLCVFCVMLFAAIRVALRNNAFRQFYDTVKAFIPWFGNTVKMLSLAKFARAFASLYAAGVLIPRALTVSAKVAGNSYFSAKIATATRNLIGGATLSQALSSTGAFPSMFISMVHTGETTGSLDSMLTKVADFYEDEAKTRLHAAVKALGVLLLLIMGIVVLLEGMKALSGYIGGLNGIMNDNG